LQFTIADLNIKKTFVADEIDVDAMSES